MSELVKKAGEFRVEAERDGSPRWCVVSWDNGLHDKQKFHGLQLGDLKDLRYCLSEIIASLEAQEPRP